jgi:glycosyltransferase involved in cell wall biosynthesis
MQRPKENKSKKRLKILIVAAAAHPEKGSEPGMGWGWVEALSKYHDLWVITGEREGNREAIERRVQEVADLSKRIKIYYIPRPDGPYIERIWPLFYYRHYRQWHQKAFQLAEKLHKDIHFDLAHQLNMIGFREPGYLWCLSLPFVWGPVGGTANVPLRFASILGPCQFLYHLVKVTFNNTQLRYHKRVRAALERADGFVTSTSDTRSTFLRVLSRDSVMINENGPPLNVQCNGQKRGHMSGQELKLAWSGLHLSRKALPIVLQALVLLPRECLWHLDILGQGPMTLRWQRLAIKLGINANCTWHGWVKKDDAINIVANADLFLFPSLHEGTPAVIFEALSVGVPVICLDHCGQADVVNKNCGIKIRITTPGRVIKSFANAIVHLLNNPYEVERLSRGALKRVEEFSWDKKALKMLNVYQDAIMHWRGKNTS